MNKESFTIIAGDIHKLIKADNINDYCAKNGYPWWFEERKGFYWVPVPDAKYDPKGKWVWIPDHIMSRLPRPRSTYFDGHVPPYEYMKKGSFHREYQ